MNTRKVRYRRHRFTPEIISSSVCAYHRFATSFRDVEDLLAECGIMLLYQSIRIESLIGVPLAYNPKADALYWQETQNFLSGVLA